MSIKKILIVDDDEDIRYSIQEILNEKYDLLEASDGLGAIEILENQLVDLIILDLMMPKMDGWNTVKKIKSNGKLSCIPIIILTAKTDPVDRNIGDLTANYYITKPFESNELKGIVKKAIKEKGK